MNLQMNDEQQMMADAIARLAREQEGASPAVLSAALAGLGVLAAVVSEEAGGIGRGMGQDGALVMAISEAAGRGYLGSALPSALTSAGLMGAGAVPEEITDAVLGGEASAAVAKLRRAQSGADGLSGQVALAHKADHYVLLDGDRAWWVAADAPGLTVAERPMVDGAEGVALTLASAAAQPLQIAPADLARLTAQGRAAAAALMLGIMERMLAETRDYVQTRQQFGVAIGTFQTIRHRMARGYVLTEQCRSLVMAALLGEEATRAADVAAAQAFVSEAALQLAHDCVQFHGGMGITDELALTRGHRQILVLSRLFGTAAEARQSFMAA